MNRFFIIALLALLGLAAQAVSAGTTYSQAGGVIYKSGDGIGTKVIGTTQGGVDQRLARHAAASSDAAATSDDAAAPTDRHKAFTRARMTAKKRPLASGAAGKERSLGGIPVDTTPNRSAYC